MTRFTRGIAPDLLVSQVRNTIPYLFESAAFDDFMPARVIRAFDRDPTQELSHLEYYRLCLSSHYSTCATPVPTDVDNQIRFKLWPRELDLETALEMTSFILESRHWDFSLVSRRYQYDAERRALVTGHMGEWFTVACAAYCALSRYPDPLARAKRDEVFTSITEEIETHAQVFGSLWRAEDGLGALKASASIAHNFGDLDRVMDMWDLNIADPLRLSYYKLGVTPLDPNGKLRYLGRLWVAGELYKSPVAGSSMALENHRHFALRKPKCLRQSPDYLVPTGPFLEDWALAVANGLPESDVLEVAEALQYGRTRLPKTEGYVRALLALGSVHRSISVKGLQPRSRAHFERAWSEEAVALMDEIPSRA